MQKQQIGDERADVAVGSGKGGPAEDLRHRQRQALHADQEHQGREMQRIEPPPAQEHEAAHAKPLPKLRAVVGRDHEAAEREEEIDEEEGVAEEGQGMDVAVGHAMERRDEACADASPSVQHPKVG